MKRIVSIVVILGCFVVSMAQNNQPQPNPKQQELLISKGLVQADTSAPDENGKVLPWLTLILSCLALTFALSAVVFVSSRKKNDDKLPYDDNQGMSKQQINKLIDDRISDPSRKKNRKKNEDKLPHDDNQGMSEQQIIKLIDDRISRMPIAEYPQVNTNEIVQRVLRELEKGVKVDSKVVVDKPQDSSVLYVSAANEKGTFKEVNSSNFENAIYRIIVIAKDTAEFHCNPSSKKLILNNKNCLRYACITDGNGCRDIETINPGTAKLVDGHWKVIEKLKIKFV